MSKNINVGIEYKIERDIVEEKKFKYKIKYDKALTLYNNCLYIINKFTVPELLKLIENIKKLAEKNKIDKIELLLIQYNISDHEYKLIQNFESYYCKNHTNKIKKHKLKSDCRFINKYSDKRINLRFK